LAALPVDAVAFPDILLENNDSRFFTSSLLQVGQLTCVTAVVLRNNLSNLWPQLLQSYS
jgi:hypothetical protein